MLKRKDDLTNADMFKFCKRLKTKNDRFDEMMSRFGDSYLAAVYILKTNVIDTSSSTYEPKRAKNRDTEKVATYYRYTSTDIDLDVDTFKEAISKGNYQKKRMLHQQSL